MFRPQSLHHVMSENSIDRATPEFKQRSILGNSQRILIALMVSAIVHIVFFGVILNLPISQAVKAVRDLSSANRPMISIQLISAEHGKKRNSAASTQQRGAIQSSYSRQEKLTVKKIVKTRTSTNFARKASIQYSKKINRKRTLKRVQYKARPKTVQARQSHMSQLASKKGDRPPLYRLGSANNPRPPYPYLARKRGWQGRVLLSVYVNQEGVAVRVLIKKGSGHSILDRTARATIAKWKFSPSLKGGQKVAASIPVPVRFTLGN